MKQELSNLDEQVAKRRDVLPSTKSVRDSLRSKNQNLRDKNGLLGNVPLLRDFEDKMVRDFLTADARLDCFQEPQGSDRRSERNLSSTQQRIKDSQAQNVKGSMGRRHGIDYFFLKLRFETFSRFK